MSDLGPTAPHHVLTEEEREQLLRYVKERYGLDSARIVPRVYGPIQEPAS